MVMVATKKPDHFLITFGVNNCLTALKQQTMSTQAEWEHFFTFLHPIAILCPKYVIKMSYSDIWVNETFLVTV